MDALPRGPRGVILTTLRQARDPIGWALRWRREYGDPMTFPPYEGKPLLVVGSPGALRTLLSAPPDSVEPLFVERIGAVLGDNSLLVMSGPRHTAMRKLLMPPFHGQRMRLYGQTIRDITLEQTRRLAPGQSFVAQELMHAISLQAIIRLVFGVAGAERIARTEQLIGRYRSAIVRSVLPLIIPFLRRNFWGFGPWAALQRATAALRALIDEEIAARRDEPGERTDILSLLLAARDEAGVGLDGAQIFEQLLTLLFAGHSTTAMTLVWALARLQEEPEVLSRLLAELDALGEDPEPEALARAPLLEAVCHETLRIYPAASAAGRKLLLPTEVAGHLLPAKSGVVVNILWAHYNPEIFPEPERFLPSRFLEKTYSPFEFLPFGGGNRRCIGAAFGLYEMKLVLGTLLSRFTFERVSKKPIRVRQFVGLEPDGPVKMRVKVRES
jgi:cytochrome P450